MPIAIPLFQHDMIVTNTADTVDYLSTYHLRQWFMFHAVYNANGIYHSKSWFPTGNFLRIRCNTLGMIVENFWQYMTIAQLIELSAGHDTGVRNKHLKSTIYHLLVSHDCVEQCSDMGADIVLKVNAKLRPHPNKLPLPDKQEAGVQQERHNRKLESLTPHSVHCRRNEPASQIAPEIIPIDLAPLTSHASDPGLPGPAERDRDFLRLLSDKGIGKIIEEWQTNMRTAAQHKRDIVKTLVEFLLENNYWYKASGIKFSQSNLDNLYTESSDARTAVPTAVDICHLNEEGSRGVEHGSTDYTDRGELQSTLEPDQDIIMEAVGYTSGDHSAPNYREMKAKLDKKRFLKVRSGTVPLSDMDPSFLASVYPHLDPWGIGGMYEPERTADQYISFDRQVRNLLLQDDSPFQKDPSFVFVCWNILQMRLVNKDACFRMKADTQAALMRDLTGVAPSLTDMIQKWDHDPEAKPTTAMEKRALKLLDRLKYVAKDVKGSSGYKLCHRNEICAMIKKMSTPALFVTINPSDTTNPLVAVIAGLDSDVWKQMTSRDRTEFVAKNPGPAAQFFDLMMTSFIKIILRYGDTQPGLFGQCKGYYGMVEAQGKGTLHCHMFTGFLCNRLCNQGYFIHTPGFGCPGVFNQAEHKEVVFGGHSFN